MSMLSAQVDKLRKVADLYDGTTQPPIAKELQRPALAQELRDAADTILSLRDRAQELQAENAKLRELVRDAWGDGHPDRSCEGCDIRDECHDDTERMRKDGVLRFSRCLFELRIEDRMRELGIEVTP